MYRFSEQDENQLEIFEKSMPFSGTLIRKNRWIKLAGLVNWRELEAVYAKTFSKTGRPGVRARYVIGSLIIKHILECSDEEVCLHLSENPYMQFFVGFPRFRTDVPYDSSTLTNVRKRLSKEQFDAFEQELIGMLTAKKLIHPKGMLTDATVFQSEITYPTDCGLLYKAQNFCVANIKRLGADLGRRVRTYCRVAHKSYLAFSKKRRKTAQDVRKMHKLMLGYVRRNIGHLDALITEAKERGMTIPKRVHATFRTIKTVYDQQKQMYKNKTKSISDRIVSIHKPYVRPIVRGKTNKEVEFGAKVSLRHVDGYLFADHVSFDNYHEGTMLAHSIERFEQAFGKKPAYVSMDSIYGSRENRAYLKEQTIRTSVKPLGRPKKDSSTRYEKQWRRQKQKERNHIEGAIGNSKTTYSLELVRAKTAKTEYSWIRFALMSRNLAVAGRRIQ